MWQGKIEKEVVCSLCKAPRVFLEQVPYRKIQLLMEAYPHQEWLGYLEGLLNKDSGDIFIEDIFIPPHKEATAASAEAEPLFTPKNCVGIIHSHHSMGAFHSGTDQAYVDKNYPVSITVAGKESKLDFDAVSYVKTPCGKPLTQKVKVILQTKALFDEAKFLEEAKDKIDKGKKIFIGIAPEPVPQLDLNTNPYHYVVGKSGRVLTKEEYVNILKGVWKDGEE